MRGRRGSSEPPPTDAPTQPPGRGDGDRKRSRQVIDRLRALSRTVQVADHQKAIGLPHAGVQTAANAGVPEDQAGLAAALITASFQLGSAPGLAVLSGIATSRTSHPAGRPHPAPGGTHRRIPAGPGLPTEH